MFRRLLAATLAAGLSLTAAPVHAAPQLAGAVFPTDIVAQDFPDPDVFQQNGTWYAYSTNSSPGTVPVATATSPGGPWTIRGDAMPGGPSAAWAQPGRTWAPDVYPNPDGTYTLTYTAWHKASGRQCIGVATATSPRGPFTPVGTEPLICPLDLGGAIDPNTFVDRNGTRYLVWKNDGNAIGKPSTLWLTKTTNNGRTLVGSNTALLSSSGIIEAPDIVQRDSRYLLFFSTGGYNDCNYQTSYATATSLTGPWSVAGRPLMTTQTFDDHVCGPGGADFVGDKVFLHGWKNNSRHLYVADVGWPNDYPVVRGSRVRTESESGQLNHCVVRANANGASDGKVVGYIDYADSWVENRVYAPVAGGYTLNVRYANGSAGTASHGLAVNGVSQGSVSYPVTGWDNWHESAVPVTLNVGWNTVRLSKGDLYTEVDYLELQ
ncbi:family 43 glycosylhydrolase [Kribbella sp. NPDC051587]|uniref:family 43 glycosylhydrolase n=1 Tax=Kribbella sp. NPDC051587 TaxID=3364119 RepID=UPI00378F0EA4